MRSSTKYVGLDVHQATTVATVRDSAGKIIARSILPTEEAALLEFFARMRGAVHGTARAGKTLPPLLLRDGYAGLPRPRIRSAFLQQTLSRCAWSVSTGVFSIQSAASAVSSYG